MSEEKETPLDLTLAGEQFRLRASAKTHTQLKEVAKSVDARVRAMVAGGEVISVARAALMTAFQLAYELKELEERSDLSKDTRKALSKKIDDMIKRIDEGIGKAK